MLLDLTKITRNGWTAAECSALCVHAIRELGGELDQGHPKMSEGETLDLGNLGYQRPEFSATSDRDGIR